MNGILVIDKPADWTSFDVIAKLRRPLGTKKIGHSGTLDPMATGVLPLFVGKASRAADMGQDHTKTYEAVMRLGIQTDTGDITGTILRNADVGNTAEDQVKQALMQLVGPQMQVPPMYSAVKINGVPLYKQARKGIEVERAARPIEVFEVAYLGKESETDYRFTISCSKGTYIRSLIEKAGESMNLPATMAALKRIRSGPYTIEQSHSLQEVLEACENHQVEQMLLPTDTVFAHLPAVEVNLDTLNRLNNGAPTYKFWKTDGAYRVYHENRFWGIGRVADHILKNEKSFFSNEE